MKCSRQVISYKSSVTSQRGFTVLELLIFSAISAVIMVAFITILVTITRIQARQSSAAEVNQQSQFLLQTIQYYVERSSLIEMNQDVATSTLKLRMAASSEDPTYIYLSGGMVYLQQSSTAAQALTTSRVTVPSLTFTRRSNAPSHDSVAVSFIVSYNTPNLQQQFSETLQTAVARVNAATFDSSVVPSSTATYSLGAAGQIWTSVNSILNFSGANVYFSSGYNVGIGVSSPAYLLQVGGGGVNGDIYIGGTGCGATGCGLILKSAGGSCARIILTNAGQISTSSVASCP